MEFSQKLSSLRKAKGLSKEELSKALGVSRQAVAEWESGQGYPDTPALVKLSEVLDVSLDYLLKGDASAGAARGGAHKIPEPPSGGLPVDGDTIRGYLAEKRARSMLNALGIGVMLASLSFWMGMGSMMGMVMFLVGLGVGIAILVYAAYSPNQYGELEKQPLIIEPSLSEDFKGFAEAQRQRFAQLNVGAVLVLVLSVIFLLGMTALPVFLRGIMAGLAAVCWGFALALFVYANTNIQALKTITHPQERAKKKKRKDYGWVPGLLVPMSVFVYLLIGFFFHIWHPTWMLIPVTAILSSAFVGWKSGEH